MRPARYLSNIQLSNSRVFGEIVKDKFVTKGTYAKMARGEMVRFMAENQIEDPKDLKLFDRLHYKYRADLSLEHQYVFERDPALRLHKI